MTKKLLLPLCIAVGLSACGGGGSSTSSSPAVQDKGNYLAVTPTIKQGVGVTLDWNQVRGADYYKLLRYRGTSLRLTSEEVASHLTGTSMKLDLDLVDMDAATADYELLACDRSNYCFVQSAKFRLKNLEQTVGRVKTHISRYDSDNVRFGKAVAWQQDYLVINTVDDSKGIAEIYSAQADGQYQVDKSLWQKTYLRTADAHTTRANQIVTAGRSFDDFFLAAATEPTESGKTEAFVHMAKAMDIQNNGQTERWLQGHTAPRGPVADSYGAALASSGEDGGMIVMGHPTKNTSGEVSFYNFKALHFPAAPDNAMKTIPAPSQFTIKRPDGLAVDAQFGASVAIAKDEVMVIGAPMDSLLKGTASEIAHGGAVYVYRKALSPRNYNEMWQLEATLSLPDGYTKENSGFGSSVVINKQANLILVGAPGIDRVLTYKYDEQRGFWSKIDDISPVKASAGQKFGSQLALSDKGFLAVSAPLAPWRGFGFHTSADTLERGGDLDGAVYIYRLNNYGNRDYVSEGAITGDSVSGVKEEFGASLKFKPGTNTLAVGAPGHPSDPELDWSDRSWPKAGAVYIF
ncbi:hypothetical protein C942_03608 [Photobacterium marinum]|uniref:Uncharacterized protein n=1 Tax=Photobacterium marinum TaxID=1056511 RepID=L8J499_9GAMM|nr:hypothetical protein [Photobacterium marinum]ELR63591.1 hypothetical protein C942_03608 [Photobacterium marinum]